jgi:hypothetical protein
VPQCLRSRVFQTTTHSAAIESTGNAEVRVKLVLPYAKNSCLPAIRTILVESILYKLPWPVLHRDRFYAKFDDNVRPPLGTRRQRRGIVRDRAAHS